MNIKHIINMLDEERKELLVILKRLNYLIAKGPKAIISIRKTHGGSYYYKRTDSSQKNGAYIRKGNAKEIRPLVQKLYNTRLKEVVEKERKQIEACLAILKKTDTDSETVINSIPQEMREYIDTDIFNDEDEVEKWRREVFMGENPIMFEKTFRTSNGEFVRSKSELIIAEALKMHGVPYLYERPFYQISVGSRKSNLYPDFTCLNKRTGRTYYWEHLGMMDNAEYASKNIRRILEYSKEGVHPGSELILSFETSEVPLSIDYIKALIRKNLL